MSVACCLPCETLMSAKQAINDKLQGSVDTSCGGIANNQIRKGLQNYRHESVAPLFWPTL